jgi:hypothetical protein
MLPDGILRFIVDLSVRFAQHLNQGRCKFLLAVEAGLRVIFVFFTGEKMELSGSGLRPVRNGRDGRKYRIPTVCKYCRMESFVLLWI